MNLQSVKSKHVKEVEQDQMLEILKAMFPTLRDVDDFEIVKAISVAQHLGLDPIRKEVHFVPFKGQIQLVVSYLEYVKRAERSGKLKGWSVDLGKDENLGIYAEVTIHRRDWEFPFKWKVYLCEVQKDTMTWRQAPTFMLKKTAIAQAFRIAFPEEVSYMPYTFDEISHEESVEETLTGEPNVAQEVVTYQVSEIPLAVKSGSSSKTPQHYKEVKPINESQIKIIKRELQTFLTENPELQEKLKELTFEDGVKIISLLKGKQLNEAWEFLKSKLGGIEENVSSVSNLDTNTEEEYENLEEFYAK